MAKTATPKETQTIKVRALSTGYYAHCRQREGDVFTLEPREVTIYNVGAGRPEYDEDGKPKMRLLTAREQFSPFWMEKVPDTTEERTTPAQAALSKANQELLDTKRPSRASE